MLVSFFLISCLLDACQEEDSSPAAASDLLALEDEQVRLKTVLRDDSLLFHSKFHPDWGQLFKSGYQDSRFAIQVRLVWFRDTAGGPPVRRSCARAT